ncbi:hypothetical protein L288_08860 [Sphingobium quisquiliarum P25]|uniref:Lipoprotein n=1 Tax=Sphingobium quisquiliarum P25 TaxID=1329909 RepID=T0I8W5_9SPHN|nr:hypothetical protein [Sphingobium quisquiliarum]EQB08125.1 hypothetical protein L288_08860 [Sphingobium quisquiliarum P25]EZP73944.1 putative uncharacterized protein precursor [Sphingomonas paucimobilis]
MIVRTMLLMCTLGAAACSQDQGSQNDAMVNSAAINRMDDAPGNMSSAPAPVSGSGQVPPNAPMNGAGGNAMGGAMGNDQAGNASAP